MKEKKLQWVKCDNCGDKIQKYQGEERICLKCKIDETDGIIIDNEHGG